jgi:hypothetical protein
MESMDPTIRLQMKNNQSDGVFSLEGTMNTFTITKGVDSMPLLKTYLNESNAVVQTNHVQANQVIASDFILQKVVSDSETILKGTQSELYGIKYTLPSRFQSHRFMTRYGENEYNEWMRIQQGRQGKAQVGIGTTLMDPLVGLHVQGSIRCDKLFMNEPFPYEPLVHSNLLWLDDRGKIPSQYLPEQYQTSILQNEAGVGIGTRVPVQKLHLEGGCYIRDRIGIGHTQPNALLHIVNASSTLPSLLIEQDIGHAIQVIHQPSQTPLFTVSSQETTLGHTNTYQTFIRGTLKTHSIETPSLTIVDASSPTKPWLHTTPYSLDIHKPAFLNEGLTCDSITSTKQSLYIQTCQLNASNASIYAKEYNASLANVSSLEALSLNPEGLLEEMERLNSKMCMDSTNHTKYRCSFIQDEFLEEISHGNETAKLLLDDQHHINQTTMIHLLWTTVKHLSRRVKELEGQKS